MLIGLVFAIVILQLQTSQILTSSHDDNVICSSVDDPHMRTFDGTPYEFHHDGSHFILYTDKKDTRITAGYQKCVYNGARCNCAIYVKKGDQIAFIDFCQISEYKSPVNRFYTVSKRADNTYGPEAIKPMNCKPIHPNQVNAEGVWNNIVPYNQFFKCAQIGDGAYVTYVLRAIDPRSPGDSVKVQVDVGPLSMPRIHVHPSQNSFENTGGLCGMWNKRKDRDLYILDDQGNELYGVNDVALKNFWSLDTIWKPFLLGKRCPECFIKAERRLYCPCDDFSLLEELTHNSTRENFCDMPMPNCVEKSLNLPISPITPTITTGVTTLDPGGSTKPPISPEQALQLCTNGIMNNPGLKPLIEAGVFNPTQAIENCVADLVLTGNVDLINLHIELSLIEALQNVLTNSTYYENGTITDAGLALLIGLCPSGCSGNGHCEINVNCLNINNINGAQVGDCLSPVMCVCNENFGGPNCAIDTLEPPNFFFNKKCCDVRNYDCDVISGYGYPIARKTKLYYKATFYETDNSFDFTGEITGVANVVNDNEFTINLPLSDYWRRNTSVVYVEVGISYNGKKYTKDTLQLYDSKCRYCFETVSNEEIKPDTCLIENACYDDGENEPGNEDNICDAENNIFEWTYIGYVSPVCNGAWSPWYNLDDPSGDGDIEILTLKQEFKCNPSEIEVFTVDDLPLEKVKDQNYYIGLPYGFICLNKEQPNGECLDYKIRQCCPA